MKTIWKFTLQNASPQIEMPVGARALSVQMQDGDNPPCLWAMVDPEQKATEIRQVVIVGTGHPIDEVIANTFEYIGTFQMLKMGLVWHAFISK